MITPNIKPLTSIENYESQYLSLFLQVFEHETDINMFRWKFSNSLSILNSAVIDEQLVGFYGFMQRNFTYKNRILNGLQSCDVMVAPHMRGRLTHSMFNKIFNNYIEYFQKNVEACHLFFGFPNQRAMKLGKRTSGYTLIDEFYWLEWREKFNHKLVKSYQVSYVPFDHAQLNLLNQCWSNMCKAYKHSYIGIRDANFIRQRYVAHPQIKYELLRVDHVITGNIAYVVIKKMNNEVLIMDVICSHDYFGTVVHCCADKLLDENQCEVVKMGITKQFSTDIIQMNPAVVISQSSPAPAAGSGLTSMSAPEMKEVYNSLYQNLFLTFGDADFL
ncbi:GNAT family N-acetyltransferase [Algibacillus agarilyticus]|uniref:GNAT family N-acetyltransferase n=1 Tax=Algibacillus agarilyticus TaxID=2234133 RepID=UPI0013008F6E|nr:GNAT family N-acetyltransferase [Algibacillus agarilyticus]